MANSSHSKDGASDTSGTNPPSKRRGVAEREQLQSVKARLYDRNFVQQKYQRSQLSSDVAVVPRSFAGVTSPTPGEAEVVQSTKKAKRRYRSYIAIIGLLAFILMMGAASYLLLTDEPISPRNIAVTIDGPQSVSGGALANLIVDISNGNSAPIKTASLQVTYPDGIRDPDTNETLTRVQIPLENIEPGEEVSVPINVLVFGEEDEEKEILVNVQYRLEGSSGTFFAYPEPVSYMVQVNTSPVNLAIDSTRLVASGQPVELTFTVRSNSPSTLNDLLVTAEYPFGFEYTSSQPESVSGQNVWRIDKLEPDESVTITVSGIVSGAQNDERVVRASVGVSESDTSAVLASTFSANQFTYQIEEQFVNLDVEANGQRGEVVNLEAGDSLQVAIRIQNPLSSTLFDTQVSVALSGSAFREEYVTTGNGFYDSLTNTVIFDQTTAPELAELQPGEAVNLSFAVSADSAISRMPEVNFLVNARARRVQDASAQESLIGTEQRVVKYGSTIDMLASVSHESGPIPPVAEVQSRYQVSFRIEAGGNDLENGRMTTSFPGYVQWFNITSGDGSIQFNPTSRQLVWNVGSVDGNDAAQINMTVGILPSISQVGTTPVLVNEQSFTATDSFSGGNLRAEFDTLTTELSREAGYQEGNGLVQRVAN